jgi:hypothetical protein
MDHYPKGQPMPSDKDTNDSVGVTDFRARCVARGKRRRVLLLKRKRLVAAIVPVEQPHVDLWGALRGTVKLAPGFDLTCGAGEAWKAAGGRAPGGVGHCMSFSRRLK